LSGKFSQTSGVGYTSAYHVFAVVVYAVCLACTASPGEFMKLITAIIRHEKIEEVKEALTRIKVTGMTVREVRGHGRQKGHKAVYHGAEYSLTLLPKAMLETVVPDEIAEQVVTTIISTARTGEIGDGRVFVYPVEHSYNVRTGESDVS
jgi:nitrogen regulatory protein PII